jgi:TolB-like protein/Tfp pilus assembly protein PilF
MSSFFSELKRRNVVRVALLYGIVSWLILQVSDVAMPALGLPEWSITLVLYFLAIGLPIALIFAWAFELTPDGLKRTGEVDPDASVAPVTGQKINHLIIGVLSVALVFVVIDSYVLKDDGDPVENPTTAVAEQVEQSGKPGGQQVVDPSAAPILTSIAVLPFADMSPAQDQEYFTDGISEELLNLLAKIPDFKVAGRTSSFAFKGKDDDLRIIGEKLGVATILEGSVRKQKDQIRVTAQLVKVDDGYHLWSDTYDRQLDDVFAIQDEIATEVVGALKQTLLGDEDRVVIASARATDNTEAYTAYLRGKHMMQDRTADGLYKALREFRHATEVDPDFALAWTGVANSYSLLSSYSYRSADEVLPLASDAVDKAIELDPDLGEAWAARGLLLMQRGAPPEEQIAALEKAVALNPSDATAMMWMSSALTTVAEADEGQAILLRAYSIDPLNPTLLMNLATNEAFRGNAEATNRYAADLEGLRPDWDGTYRLKNTIASLEGQKDEELRWAKKALHYNPESPDTMMTIAHLYMDFGDRDRAREYASRAREVNPLHGDAIALQAELRFSEGDSQGAWALIDRTLQKQPNDPNLLGQAGGMALREGRPDEARAYYERILRPADGAWAMADFVGIFNAAELVALYREAGQPDLAEALRRQCDGLLDSLGAESTWFVPFLRARLAGAAGDRDAALVNLREAVDRNAAGGYLVENLPGFAEYSDDPEIGPLLDTMVARRDEFARRVAAEDL